ncbi:hypothetical protein D9M69_578710 [compost metagenome]
MQHGDAGGELEADAAGRAPRQTDSIQHRFHGRQGAQGRPLAGGALAQLFRAQQTLDRADRHDRRQTLFATRTPETDGDHARPTEHPADHHGVAGGQGLMRPGGSIGGELVGGHAPEQVVGSWVVAHAWLLYVGRHPLPQPLSLKGEGS